MAGSIYDAWHAKSHVDDIRRRRGPVTKANLEHMEGFSQPSNPSCSMWCYEVRSLPVQAWLFGPTNQRETKAYSISVCHFVRVLDSNDPWHISLLFLSMSRGIGFKRRGISTFSVRRKEKKEPLQFLHLSRVLDSLIHAMLAVYVPVFVGGKQDSFATGCSTWPQ